MSADFWFQNQGGGGAQADLIPGSLRFRENQFDFLKRTNTTNATDGRFVTAAFWYKPVELYSNSKDLSFIHGGANPDTGGIYNEIRNDNNFVWNSVLTTSSQSSVRTRGKMRDISGWYHLVWTYDSTKTTPIDAIRLYINGVDQTAIQAHVWNQNYPCPITKNGNNVYIGAQNDSGSQVLNGYLADFHLVDGQVLSPTSFGTFDDRGVWVPAKSTVSNYGNNGFKLDFQDPVQISGKVWEFKDKSGNGNHFRTLSNCDFTFDDPTSGKYDLFPDSPSNNYPVNNVNGPFKPSLNSPGPSGSGNLTLAGPNGSYSWYTSNQKMQGGKHFAEFRVTNSIQPQDWEFGFLNMSQAIRNGVWQWTPYYNPSFDTCYIGYRYYNAGSWYVHGSGKGSMTSFGISTGDVIGLAVDTDSGRIELFRNGVSQGTYTGSEINPNDEYVWLYRKVSGDAAIDLNFGQRQFIHTPPADYVGLGGSASRDEVMADPQSNFKPITYTGNGGTQTITTGFRPGMIMIKSLDGVRDWKLFDAVRGPSRAVVPNDSFEETTHSDMLGSFDDNGFTLNGGANDTNITNGKYVAYCWATPNNPQNNTNGSVTSVVDVNPEAGFSIVSYTGTNTNESIGHGLTKAPEMIWVKKRSGGRADWAVYQNDIGPSRHLTLNQSYNTGSAASMWGSEQKYPDNQVFNIGSADMTGRAEPYIAYCWHSVPGFSKMGMYYGNGDAGDGMFVHLDFTPAWLMVKAADSGQPWLVYDLKRDEVNPANTNIKIDTQDTSRVDTDGNHDHLSCGFKFYTATPGLNAGNERYIYAAFAEAPAFGSNVYPAPARN